MEAGAFGNFNLIFYNKNGNKVSYVQMRDFTSTAIQDVAGCGEDDQTFFIFTAPDLTEEHLHDLNGINFYMHIVPFVG
jgi:hypothetical protein